MSSNYDRLAGRLSDRMAASPQRGQALDRDDVEPGAPADPPRRPRRSTRSSAAERPARAEPTVRRGHLVPDATHRRARREKLRRRDGAMVTWSDVLVDGIERLLDHPDIAELLGTLSPDAGPKRLVQASLPADLDRRFAARRLDLDDALDGPVTHETLWTLAIELWVDG